MNAVTDSPNADPRPSLIKWIKSSPFRIYVAILTLAAFPLSLFVISGHQLLVGKMTQQLMTQGTQVGSRIGDLVEERLTQDEGLLGSFAKQSSLIEDLTARDFPKITGRLEQAHALRPDFLFFSVYDPDGTMRAISPADAKTINRSFALRDWYKGVIRDSRPYVSEAYQAEFDDHPQVVAVAVPIKDPRGQLIGILMAPRPVDSVLKEVRSLTTPKRASVI